MCRGYVPAALLFLLALDADELIRGLQNMDITVALHIELGHQSICPGMHASIIISLTFAEGGRGPLLLVTILVQGAER